MQRHILSAIFKNKVTFVTFWAIFWMTNPSKATLKGKGSQLEDPFIVDPIDKEDK